MPCGCANLSSCVSYGESEKDFCSSFHLISERPWLRLYQCSECKSCPSRGECCKGKGNRSVEINWELEARKYQTKALLQSEKGIYLCGRRCAEVENVFGQLKWNSGFTRFHLRGLKKVLLEWKLLCIGHNLRRMTMLSATTE